MFKNTKKITFYSYDTDIKKVCRCFITDKSYAVFSNNCPVHKEGLSSGSCLDGWGFWGKRNRVRISVDKDYYEECAVNPGFTRSILADDFSEIENIAKKCPFNAKIVSNPPKIDKSAKEIKRNKELITKFDILYVDPVYCPCSLSVEDFGIFRRLCPVCKPKKFEGDVTISQYYAYDDSRHIDICVDRQEHERDFFVMAYNNAQKIQDIIKTCRYYRKDYIDNKIKSKTK